MTALELAEKTGKTYRLACKAIKHGLKVGTVARGTRFDTNIRGHVCPITVFLPVKGK